MGALALATWLVVGCLELVLGVDGELVDVVAQLGGEALEGAERWVGDGGRWSRRHGRVMVDLAGYRC